MNDSGETAGACFLRETRTRFQGLKKLADGAIVQVPDADRFHTLHPEGNSIAVLMKHMAGNMRSRWVNFLTTDGEKPDRHRDTEFELDAHDTAAALQERWEAAWQILFDALDPLTEADLMRTIFIRGQAHTVISAIQRQFSHYAYHIGQIVQLARYLRGDDWQTLSVPRGQTEAFNAKMRAQTGKSF